MSRLYACVSTLCFTVAVLMLACVFGSAAYGQTTSADPFCGPPKNSNPGGWQCPHNCQPCDLSNSGNGYKCTGCP